MQNNRPKLQKVLLKCQLATDKLPQQKNKVVQTAKQMKLDKKQAKRSLNRSSSQSKTKISRDSSVEHQDKNFQKQKKPGQHFEKCQRPKPIQFPLKKKGTVKAQKEIIKVNLYKPNTKIVGWICPNCLEQIVQQNRHKHQSSQCSMRAIICRDCNKSFPFMVFKDHQSVCERYKRRIRSQAQLTAPSPRKAFHPIIEWSPRIMNYVKKDCLNLNKIEKLTCVSYQQHLNPNHDCCSICSIEFIHEERIIRLDCDHLYHIYCISDWLSRHQICPFCKRAVD